MLTTDSDTPRRYPRLSAVQMDRVCDEVRLYFAAIDWVRSGHQARDFAYPGAQLALFSHRDVPGDIPTPPRGKP
jgi:hypothetical protein